MKDVLTRSKVIVFTCNWQAYHSLDAAGRLGLPLSADVISIRLPCLGRITPGLILKTFENGAAGVCLLGCPEGQCCYRTGNQQAAGVYQEAKQLLGTLGYNQDLLQYQQIPAGEAEGYKEILGRLLEIVCEDNGGP